MSLFGNLKSDGLEETQDRLGGFSPFDTDIYTGKIKMAYAGQSDGGAKNVSLVVDFNGKEYRETIYITNKKGENFFLNKDDKTKKVPLPGFTIIDDICLVTTEKPLSDQAAEEKVIKLYDFEAKKELPKTVPVLVDLLGKEVSLAIVRQLEKKNAKNGAGHCGGDFGGQQGNHHGGHTNTNAAHSNIISRLTLIVYPVIKKFS